MNHNRNQMKFWKWNILLFHEKSIGSSRIWRQEQRFKEHVAADSRSVVLREHLREIVSGIKMGQRFTDLQRNVSTLVPQEVAACTSGKTGSRATYIREGLAYFSKLNHIKLTFYIQMYDINTKKPRIQMYDINTDIKVWQKPRIQKYGKTTHSKTRIKKYDEKKPRIQMYDKNTDSNVWKKDNPEKYKMFGNVINE